MEATEKLSKIGIKAGVLHNNTIKPFDEKNLIKYVKKTKLIVTVEEHLVSGGLGSIVLETLNKLDFIKINKVLRLGINNEFVRKYGSQKDLLDFCNISSQKIFNIVKKNK